MRLRLTCGLTAALTILSFRLAVAQTPSPPQIDPDLGIDLAQPDFAVIGLPTTLRLPKFKGAFRVTHRFTRPLGQGSFGALAGDMFGLDSGAQIGLEYRFGIMRGTQIGVHRTSERTIQFFAQHELIGHSDNFPITIDVIGAANGTNNFRDSHSPSIGGVVSWTVADRAAFYVEPMWINNTNPLPSVLVDHNDTTILGLATRVRVRPSVYLSVEASPRVAGYEPGVTQVAFALEKRLGGHLFQLNFSNGFGTTFSQIARGGTRRSNWYLGFNISRKFW